MSLASFGEQRSLRAESRGAGSSSEDEERLGAPGKVHHHCTDCFWLLVLVLAMVVETRILHFSLEHQKIHVLLEGAGSSPSHCGTNASDGYQLFCRVQNFEDQEDSVQFSHPACVKECPTGNTTKSACFDPRLNRTQRVIDYPSVRQNVSGFMYCFPDRGTLPELHSAVQLHVWRVTMVRFLWHTVGELFESYPFILCILGLTIVLSYFYLYMVEEGGDKIVWVCTAVSVGFAGYKGYVLLAPLVLEDVQDADTSSCNEEDGVIGVLMLLFACTILGVFLSRCKDLAVASGYVQAAAECVFQVSGLLLEPLISLVVKLLLPIQLLASFFLFLSTGFRRDDMGDLVIEFDEDCPGVEAIVYYIFLFFWLEGFCYALSRYVLSYATQLWYRTDYNRESGKKEILQNCAICEAYTNAFKYHLGSFAMGSLFMVVVDVFRVPLVLLDNQPEDSVVNTVCWCCLRCYRDHIEAISLDAYMDMCVSSRSYVDAGRRVAAVKRERGGAVKRLDGAQVLFSLSGMSMVTASVDVLAFFLCEKVKGLDYEWRSVIVWTTFCSFIVCFHFMSFFDAVADSLLYFYAIDQAEEDEDDDFFGFLWEAAESEKPTHVPRGLQALLESSDGHGKH